MRARHLRRRDVRAGVRCDRREDPDREQSQRDRHGHDDPSDRRTRRQCDDVQSAGRQRSSSRQRGLRDLAAIERRARAFPGAKRGTRSDGWTKSWPPPPSKVRSGWIDIRKPATTASLRSGTASISASSRHMRAKTGTRIEETARLVDEVDRYIKTQIPANELGGILDNIGLPTSGINMAVSSSHSGTAIISCDRMSGGVNIAPMTKAPTMT